MRQITAISPARIMVAFSLMRFSEQLKRISEFPDAAPVIRGQIRKKLIAKFPYSVIYSVHPDEIRILAVAHQKRRPFYWRSRH
jgi:plasmid stabilization system protein ParE